MKLIIFDCDGVLLDTEALTNQCEVDAINQLGYNFSLEDYLDISVGHHSEQIQAILQKNHGIALPDGFWQTIADSHEKLFEEKLQAVGHVQEVIPQLNTLKCIASNSDLKRLLHTLKITNLLPHFQNAIFSAQMVARGKPAPDVFLHAAEKMGVDPKDCLVIEDSLAGITAALAAGMTVHAFGGGKHMIDCLQNKLKKSGAHHFFTDMRELPSLINKLIACI